MINLCVIDAHPVAIWLINAVFLLYSTFDAQAQRNRNGPEFKIIPRVIERGESVVLTWNINKAESAELVGIQDELPVSGSYTYFPDSTQIIEIKFYLKNGTFVSKKRKINVVLPVIKYFEVPDSATDEEEIKIRWRAENALYVQLKGIPEKFGLADNFHLHRDTTFETVIYAVGKYNIDSLKDTTKVNVIENSGISKKIIYRGDTLSIFWKTKRCKGVYVDNKDFLLPAEGDKVFHPRKDTVITLLAGRRYDVTDTLGIFHIRVMEPYISYFWGENSILRGDRSILTWNVNGGDSISIEGLAADLPGKGQLQINPDKTTTYVLRVKDGLKILTKVWKINVYPFRKYVSSTRNIYDEPVGVPLEMDIISVDRTAYPDEMIVRVVVVDTSGNYISGLAPPLGNDSISKIYFSRLSETIDNKNNTLKFNIREIQESASTPYDFSLVLDYSGSMAGTIDYLEESVKTFILRKYLNDRISITKFDDKISTVSPLLSNSEEVFDYYKFDKLTGFGGKTALYAGADKGLTVLDSSDRKKVMILFTDGYENSSLIYFGHYAFTANQLAQHLRQSNTRLFIISYGTGTNSELLLQLANLSDGKIYFINNPENVTRVFEEMPRVLHQYYEIRYKPIESPGNHRVILNFNNHAHKTGSVFFDYFIGDDFDISDKEFDEENYWYRTIDGKKPVSAPQVAVNFVFNEDYIREDYIPNLEKYLKYLETYPESELDVLAHADHVGTEEQCFLLTKKRADAVKKYFVSKGIDERRIHPRSFGKSFPVWPIEDETWKSAENRRVELIIYE